MSGYITLIALALFAGYFFIEGLIILTLNRDWPYVTQNDPIYYLLRIISGLGLLLWIAFVFIRFYL